MDSYGFYLLFCIPMFQPLVLFSKCRNVKSPKALLSDITGWMFFRFCDTTVSAVTTPLTTRERLSLSFSSGFVSVVGIEGGLLGNERSYGADLCFFLFPGKPAYSGFSLATARQCDGPVGERALHPSCRHNREMWCYRCVSPYMYADTHIYTLIVCVWI